MEKYMAGFKRWNDFNGRSTRSDFWTFTLGNMVVAIVLALLATYVLSAFGILSVLFSLLVLVPSIALTVRRLHDFDASGWFILIGFIPVIGLIAMIVFGCIPGTEGSNKFGE